MGGGKLRGYGKMGEMVVDYVRCLLEKEGDSGYRKSERKDMRM